MQYNGLQSETMYDFFSRLENNHLELNILHLFLKSQFFSLFLWGEVCNNQPLQYTIGFMELKILGLQNGPSTFKPNDKCYTGFDKCGTIIIMYFINDNFDDLFSYESTFHSRLML